MLRSFSPGRPIRTRALSRPWVALTILFLTGCTTEKWREPP
jgi:hypothetical protein